MQKGEIVYYVVLPILSFLLMEPVRRSSVAALAEIGVVETNYPEQLHILDNGPLP